MKSIYRQVIIIGYGKTTGEVIGCVADKKDEFGYDIEFIEHEIHPLSVTLRVCEERSIENKQITDKAALKCYFEKLIQENEKKNREAVGKNDNNGKILIISASNNYLFPKEISDNENVTIINFHNALLPDYPGRNAPTWVMYNDETQTGITWHYVNSGVDEGDIIIQKKCEITKDMKAFELTEKLMDLASEAFRECIENVLLEKVKPQKQNFDRSRRMYKSYEIPQEGHFNINDKVEDIYRLLRSVDYGKNDIFPKMKTDIASQEVEVLRYRKVSADKVKEEDSFLFLPFEDGDYLKIKIRVINNEN